MGPSIPVGHRNDSFYLLLFFSLLESEDSEHLVQLNQHTIWDDNPALGNIRQKNFPTALPIRQIYLPLL